MKRPITWLQLLFVWLFMVAAGGIATAPVRAASVTVTVGSMDFSPDPTINVGDTVEWDWQSSNHSTTSAANQAESWDSGLKNFGGSFSHTFTQAGVYHYYCVIHGLDNGDGTAGGMAGIITVEDSAPIDYDLTVSATGSTQAKLSWFDNNDAETGFKIEMKVGAAGAWTQVYTVGATAGTGSVRTYTRTGLTPQTRYGFRVRGYTGPVNEDYSNEVFVTPLGAPTGLAATSPNSTQVLLSCVDHAIGETGFQLEFKTTGAWGLLATLPAKPGTGGTVTSLRSGLTPDTLYSFRIRAANAQGVSNYTSQVNIRPVRAPSNLTAAATNSTAILLTFLDNSGFEAGFKVEWRTGGGAYSLLVSLGASTGTGGTKTYTKSGLTPGTVYGFRVRANTTAGFSSFSNAATASTIIAPTNLTVVVVSAGKVTLQWLDNAANEAGFKIEYKTPGMATFALLATASAGAGSGTTRSFTKSGLTVGTAHTFRVRAYNSTGFSNFTNAVVATP